MTEWKDLLSPRLRVPMELREVAPAGGCRIWEVQELRGGSVFKAALPAATLAARARRTPAPRELPEVAIERAVCLAVEDALLEPPDKEPGETYDVTVTAEHLAGASRTD